MKQIGDLIKTEVNQVPAKQELTPLKSGEEQKFAAALSANTIRKIQTTQTLAAALRKIMLKIGIRAQNLPTQEEKQVLIEHILLNYGGHSVEEILLAFDMAIMGKLNVDANCYENFSCIYFSSIMNAYRAWAVQTHQQLNQKAAAEEEKIVSAEELKNEMRAQTEAAYQRLRNGNTTYLPTNIMEQILKEDGLLKEQSLDQFLLTCLNTGKKNLYVQSSSQT